MVSIWQIAAKSIGVSDQPIALPARVRTALETERQKAELLISWVQAIILAIWTGLYLAAPRAFPEDVMFEPVPWTLGLYAVILGVRLWLSLMNRLSDLLVGLFILFDVSALMVLIWSFHLQYQQPAAFYLKAPTILYIFIFITVRALRFEPRWIIFTGAAGAAGWSVLLVLAILADDSGSGITRDYITYMTSATILLGAEFDKIITIAIVSLILAIALMRARRTMERAVHDHLTVTELSRFVSSDVATTISSAHNEIRPGQAETRLAAALFVDLRGFTDLARQLSPADLMAMLGDYQKRVISIVARHNGQIDKFLGDGIFASFGAARDSGTCAADALVSLEEILLELEDWRRGRLEMGLAAPSISAAAASGEVLFGAVGDNSRLEYTVLGDPVNIASKLEKHTRIEHANGLTDAGTLELAEQQGFKPRLKFETRSGRMVNGVNHPMDIVAIVL
ncbi:adenylate cyclase [Dongia mobilis]|uniref:Adenylate cyclase n=1 Tax=Dongia mobilis TaxID=578943 RepID=A0A4R6WUK4_9PROT|nr:adenylate/guanylate cyclase domain-containing protein [Dongia mobilis]TDQ84089.1 adenylate cyclase [Dongia mobilis]